MTRKKHCDASCFRQLANEITYFVNAGEIETVRRFIEDEQFRIAEQRPDDP